MKLSRLLLTVLVLAALVSPALSASPFFNHRANRIAPGVMWHKGYYDPAWGVPYAQVVPRRANLQTKWTYGVTGTSIEPIYNQFQRFPGQVDGEVFSPTPNWPGHTDQFGGYYVRTPRH